ncbi:hypothetical protein SRIMM317S_04345 [Streptomyces rimosus subsp. rimosus]
MRRDGAGTQQAGENLLRAKVTFPLARTVALLPRQDATALWQSLVGGLDTDGSHRVAARIHDCGALARCRADAETLLDDAGRCPRSAARLPRHRASSASVH